MKVRAIFGMIHATGLLFWLAACSANLPQAGREPEVEPPLGRSSGDAIAPATASSPPTDQVNRIGVTVADHGEDENVRALHWQSLVATNSDALDSDEVGYYSDILEARLIQQLRDERVRFNRQGNIFTLVIAGNDAFDSNQSQLKPGVSDALASITAVLEEYRKTQIAIAGHSDDTGEAGYNQTLSERRAQAVARYLIDGGVAANRIVIIGYGESQPRDVNTTREGRGRNRRIELLVVPLEKPPAP